MENESDYYSLPQIAEMLGWTIGRLKYMQDQYILRDKLRLVPKYFRKPSVKSGNLQLQSCYNLDDIEKIKAYVATKGLHDSKKKGLLSSAQVAKILKTSTENFSRMLKSGELRNTYHISPKETHGTRIIHYMWCPKEVEAARLRELAK